MIVFAAIEVHELKAALIVNPGLYSTVKPLVITAPCVIAASLFSLVWWVYKLYYEFGCVHNTSCVIISELTCALQLGGVPRRGCEPLHEEYVLGRAIRQMHNLISYRFSDVPLLPDPAVLVEIRLLRVYVGHDDGMCSSLSLSHLVPLADSIQLLIIVLNTDSAEFGLTIAAIPVVVVLLILCSIAVQREVKWYAPRSPRAQICSLMSFIGSWSSP